MDIPDKKAKYKVGDVLQVAVRYVDPTLYRIIGVHASISAYPYAGLSFSYDIVSMEANPLPIENIHEETINSMFELLPFYDAHRQFDCELDALLKEDDDNETE